MFTGIVEELGSVEGIDSSERAARLQIRSPLVLSDTAPGDSIAVNGCCLTVTEHDGQVWSADVIGTTLAATSLGRLAAGDRVNLERSVRADARLGGHIVQGHVDGVGEVVAVEADEDGGGGHLVRIALPDGVTRYVVGRGSIAVDGVSLTVVSVADAVVTIGLIPETLARTTLGLRGVGSGVNIEVDVLAKYVENLLPGPEAVAPR
jgi:riboflavin synthase